MRSYRFPIILLISIILGGICGNVFGAKVLVLKPLGEIFLNLLFTIIIPLIFFSAASAIANLGEVQHIKRIFLSMFVVFIITGFVAAIFMLIFVVLFPPAHGVMILLPQSSQHITINLGEQLAQVVTVSDVSKLLLPNNILALIIFSILVGLATAISKEKGKVFASFLQSGAEVFMKVFSLIMYYAPIGFFAYFAVTVSEIGPKLLNSYFQMTVIYYVAAILYFVVAFSIYAFLSDHKCGPRLFWKNCFAPGLTAFATCSSAASIPANLQAAKNMKVPAEIYDTVIPIGTVLHKEGSVLGGMIKIAFLFGLFHLNLLTPSNLMIAIIVSILVGTVMGAIPSGGMLGELLILSVYHFPPGTLMVLATISLLIDPIATVLNVVGNTVSCLLVSRLTIGRNWLRSQR